ncbi:hypothetical protein AB5N19_06928 [Seiridium cardinale]|uniref:Uncharacterized protein n=1 Tax=Seiridium cardinale TaxID=138064 RepID=A0ABR2XK86_9PEZI
MPMNEDGKLEHPPAKSTDPAHSSSGNTDHTTKNGEKPTTAIEAITDPSFFPTLDGAPLSQKLKSYAFLVFLVFGAVSTLWFFGFELFQTAPPAVEIPLAVPGDEDGPPNSLGEIAMEVGLMTGGASAAILALLFFTGTANLDFWSLVMEYGWWTLPAIGSAGLLFVMAQENTYSIKEVE